MNHFVFSETLELLTRGALSLAHELCSHEMRAVNNREYTLMTSKHPLISVSGLGKEESSDNSSHSPTHSHSFLITVEWDPLPIDEEEVTLDTSVIVRAYVSVETQTAGLIVQPAQALNSNVELTGTNPLPEKHIAVYYEHGLLNDRWEQEFVSVLHKDVFLVSPLTHVQDFGAEDTSNISPDESTTKTRELSEREKQNKRGLEATRYQEAWLKAFDNRDKPKV